VKTNDRRTRLLKWTSGILILILLVVAPIFLPDYWLHVSIISLFYALMASSWSLLAGYAGLFSLAHIAFMGIGAYTSGLLGYYLGVPPVLGIIVGTLASGFVGLIIGFLCLRLKSTYLALFTIAFAEILRIVIKSEHMFTRGDKGLRLDPIFPDTISRVPYYYLILALLLVCLAFMFWIVRSRIGIFLRAIREDETAAAARGVDVVKYKILAFIITSMIAGLAGGFYAHYTSIITPNIMVLLQMDLLLAMAIIGGMESLVAAAIGGFIIEYSLEVLRVLEFWRMVAFGVLLVVTLRFAQNGLIAPLLNRIYGGGPKAELRKREEEAA